jgi:hypothetical protein
MSLTLVSTYLFHSPSFEHLFRDWVGKGAVRVHLQQRKPETQAQLLQVLLCLTLVADPNALQNSAMRYVSLLLIGEFIEQVVADLVLDTANSNIATDACLGAYMKVCLSCLQTKILFTVSVLVQCGFITDSIPRLRPSL